MQFLRVKHDFEYDSRIWRISKTHQNVLKIQGYEKYVLPKMLRSAALMPMPLMIVPSVIMGNRFWNSLRFQMKWQHGHLRGSVHLAW